MCLAVSASLQFTRNSPRFSQLCLPNGLLHLCAALLISPLLYLPCLFPVQFTRSSPRFRDLLHLCAAFWTPFRAVLAFIPLFDVCAVSASLQFTRSSPRFRELYLPNDLLHLCAVYELKGSTLSIAAQVEKKNILRSITPDMTPVRVLAKSLITQ